MLNLQKILFLNKHPGIDCYINAEVKRRMFKLSLNIREQAQKDFEAVLTAKIKQKYKNEIEAAEKRGFEKGNEQAGKDKIIADHYRQAIVAQRFLEGLSNIIESDAEEELKNL